MLRINQYSEMNRCIFCGQWSAVEPVRQSAPSSYLQGIAAALPKFLVSFLNPHDVHALGHVNSALRKICILDMKKYSFIDRESSLLTACRVQHLLYNTEENPMTSEGALKLVKLEISMGINILPFSSIHYLRWDSNEKVKAEKTIKEIIRKTPLDVLLPHITKAMNDPDSQTIHDLNLLSNYTALHKLEFKILELGDEYDLILASLIGSLKSLSLNLSPHVELHFKEESLARFTGLKHLELQNFGKSTRDTDLNALSHLTSLESLSFKECEMRNANLSTLAGLTALQVLNFASCRDISAANVVQLVHLTALRDLSFSRGLRNVEELRRMTTLRGLTIHECCFTDDHLNKINTLCNLQKLTLSSTGITSSGLTQLQGLNALSELNILNIHLNKGECLRELWDYLPALQILTIDAIRPSGIFLNTFGREVYTRQSQ